MMKTMTKMRNFLLFSAILCSVNSMSIKFPGLLPKPQESSEEENPYKNTKAAESLLEFPYKIHLDPNGRLVLRWATDFERERIVFSLRAAIDDHERVGMGFSAYGEPEEADLVLFWRDEKRKVHFKDAWTDRKGLIHYDEHDDYRLLDIDDGEEGVEITFERKFDTCDDNDYNPIDNGTTHIIFFTGRFYGKPRGLDGVELSLYRPGIQRAQLLKSQVKIPPIRSDTFIVDMMVTKVHVPDDDTTYWCQIQKLPEMKKVHHMIRFDGMVEPSHEMLVHHMEIFHCEVPMGVEVPYYSGPCPEEGKTMAPNVPKPLKECKRVIGAWAMGARPFTYPEEAGVPIGGKDFSRYVMVQVHYNNPERKAGIIDSSGIRFYVTPHLRQFDAGALEFGLEYTPKNSIPPGHEGFWLTGDCISECTRVALPPQGIVIFGSQLHTHLTGRKVVTKHIRNGVELPELNRDEHYSPHFQEIRLLSEPRLVKPGDSLTTSCMYHTTDKMNITMGGFAITDEMCVNYIHYYPKIDLEVCKSSVDTDVLHGFFKFMHNWDKDATSPSKGIEDNYRSIRWTPMTSHLLKTLYDESPISMQCNRSNGDRFPGNWDYMPQSEIVFPIKKPERRCLNQASRESYEEEDDIRK
ncbi:dopamine beta-hydroxylase-like [Lineus longissimus]|uniref:dopamine beta-hydroxylase-like n=1 Tax=Lineus longissimus TaxID=88925 RepID=UPI00315CBB20